MDRRSFVRLLAAAPLAPALPEALPRLRVVTSYRAAAVPGISRSSGPCDCDDCLSLAVNPLHAMVSLVRYKQVSGLIEGQVCRRVVRITRCTCGVCLNELLRER